MDGQRRSRSEMLLRFQREELPRHSIAQAMVGHGTSLPIDRGLMEYYVIL